MSMTWSPELTFVPARAPHEIRRKSKGQRVVDLLNDWFMRDLAAAGLHIHAKLDPFNVAMHPNGLHWDTPESWCIEITPALGHPFDSDWLHVGNESYTGFMAAIELLFGLMEKLGYVPAVTKRVRRKGRLVDRDWPTGGCHIHVGADLFALRPYWYERTERFHRNLVMDYANRPYIRWLLAQWSDDHNSKCLVTSQTCNPMTGAWRRPKAEELWRKAIVGDCHALEARFMAASKASYLTFEVRCINMVRSAAELRAVALIVTNWFASIAKLTANGGIVRPTITGAKLARYSDIGESRSICDCWLDSICESGIVSSIKSTVHDLYERNYATRILHGALV